VTIKIVEPVTRVIKIAGLQGVQGIQGPVGGTLPGAPTITSFEYAQHDHEDAAGGGQLAAAAISDFDTEVEANTAVAANTAHRGTTTGNPHSVTKSDVGLGSVPNVDARARSTHTGTQTAATISDFDTEVGNHTDVAANTAHRGTTTGNPHSVTKSDVGLGSVPNVDATARANHTGTQTAATISDFDTEVGNHTDVAANTAHRGTTTGNPHSVTKSDVGLGSVPNVDATARANHTGTQAASTISDFDTEVGNHTDVAANTAHRGITTGNPHSVTKSDVGLGSVPNVDATARANHTGTQAASTISDFDTEVGNHTDVAANTAHRGTTTGNPHSVTKSDVGLGSVPNTDATNADNISSGTLAVARGGTGVSTLAALRQLMHSVGDYKFAARKTDDSNVWLRCDGRTIGDASSGGTARANADMETLFTHLWDNFANTELAVSGGRGVSAAADFAAHKTIVLPDLRGRVAMMLDDPTGSSAADRVTGTWADTLGGASGAETHALTGAENGTHTHDLSISNNWTAAGNAAPGRSNTGVTGTIGGVIAASGSGTAHNNMQPSYAGGVYLIYTGN
jgi:hypothetical protein